MKTSTTTYNYVDSPDGIVAIFVKKGDGKATQYYVERLIPTKIRL